MVADDVFQGLQIARRRPHAYFRGHEPFAQFTVIPAGSDFELLK
jgi:hypothetical protein